MKKHQHQVTLPAAPDEVWRAITEARELERWFPVRAAVTPGPGGSITYAWPPDFEGTVRIETWDPPRHLRTDWCFRPPGIAADEWRRVAVDWHIEGHGGGTTLRVVHSGFGDGAAWDDEIDGTRRGWIFELGSLAHYLARHRGKPRETLWLRRPTALPAAVAWDRLAPALAPLLDTPRRLIDELPLEVAGVVPALDDGLFRAGIERFGGSSAHVWLAAWGKSRAELETFAAPFARALASLPG